MSVISKDKREHAIALLTERDGPNCYYCGRDFTGIGRHRTIDHATPKSRGGTGHLFNLRMACFGCNHMKGDMTEEEFFASQGLKESLAAIANAARKRWRTAANDVGLRIDGPGFWHDAFAYEDDCPRCKVCNVRVEHPVLLRWVPCMTVPITLY